MEGTLLDAPEPRDGGLRRTESHGASTIPKGEDETNIAKGLMRLRENEVGKVCRSQHDHSGNAQIHGRW